MSFNYSEIQGSSDTEAIILFEGQSTFPEFYDFEGNQLGGEVRYLKEDGYIEPLPKGWWEDEEEIGGDIYEPTAQNQLQNYQFYLSSPSVTVTIEEPYFVIEEGNKLGTFVVTEDLEVKPYPEKRYKMSDNITLGVSDIKKLIKRRMRRNISYEACVIVLEDLQHNWHDDVQPGEVNSWIEGTFNHINDECQVFTVNQNTNTFVLVDNYSKEVVQDFKKRYLWKY